MNRKFTTKDLILSGILLALGLLIPILFHTVGATGPIFLPMHISVLIGGFLLSPVLAFIVGVITPLLSSVLTGMPVIFPMAVIMMFELGAYGLVASIASKKFNLPTIPSLIVSMIVGRLVAGITVLVLSSFFGVKMNPIIFVKGAVVTGVPGMAIQIILIPTIVYALSRVEKNKKVIANR